MKYINEDRINGLLGQSGKSAVGRFEGILDKSRRLQRLTLEETAVLIAADDQQSIARIFETAAYVKDTIYGRRVVLFAPLYISNLCCNGCLYCSFKADNTLIERRALSTDQIKEQVRWLLSRGHKRILMVAAESPEADGGIGYYVRSVQAIYSVKTAPGQYIRRVNVNCAPMEVAELKLLKAAGIGTYQLFQETYHEATYRRVHPFGPKSDPDNRITAIDRAFRAGIDDVGIGVLYGLYDWRFETLAVVSHIEHLEKEFKVGPHTISVPRIEPAHGSELSQAIPAAVSDHDFKRLVAILRLAVPYTGIILSTRETPAMRDAVFSLGVSQISAESRTAPGGYEQEDNNRDIGTQFTIGDQRSLDEVIGSLIAHGFIPSFCAACYRAERTGEAFMNLARPGTIKNKCSLNALITLKEYLDDFASDTVKQDGYRFIREISAELAPQEKQALSRFFEEIERGVRDQYI